MYYVCKVSAINNAHMCIFRYFIFFNVVLCITIYTDFNPMVESLQDLMYPSIWFYVVGSQQNATTDCARLNLVKKALEKRITWVLRIIF